MKRNPAMTTQTRLIILLALGLLIVGPSALFAKDVEDRNWIEVRTPNFEIRSLLREEQTIKLAHHLEVFRVVASIVTNTRLVDSPVPTEIYAIGSGRASKSFAMDTTTAGFFRDGLRKNTIVVRNTVGVKGVAIIMHEYVHFLLRNQGNTNYPMWFHEGFAEYLSSAAFEDGIVTIGNMPKHRIGSFKYGNWINLRQVISRNGGDDWGPKRGSMFYAESWGLVHYLQNREDDDKPFGQRLQHYVQLMDSGIESVEAFEEAFATNMHDLDKNVRRYLGGNRIPGFRFELDAVVTNFEPEVGVLSREQISLALGHYGLMINELEKAERWYTIAANDERYKARAEAGLGDVQKFQENYDAAQPYFQRAIELAPDDPLCQLDMAEYWHDRARATEEEEEQAVYLAKARDHYLIAWKLDESMPETYAMYGESFLIDGKDYNKAIEMLEQAQSLLPSSIQIRLFLAEAYQGDERKDESAAAARSVLAWTHGESEAAEKAQEILDGLESEGTEARE